MCLAFLWWKAHPTVLAVLLFNRDEVLDRYRPTVLCTLSVRLYAGTGLQTNAQHG